MKIAGELAWRRIKNLDMTTSYFTSCKKLKPCIKQYSIKDYQNQIIAKQALTRCAENLETLSLNYFSDSLFMPLIIKNCHNLRKLIIYFTSPYGEKYNDVFVNMKNLKCLDLKSFRGCNTEIFKSLPESIEEISIKTDFRINDVPKLIFSEDFENVSRKFLFFFFSFFLLKRKNRFCYSFFLFVFNIFFSLLSNGKLFVLSH